RLPVSRQPVRSRRQPDRRPGAACTRPLRVRGREQPARPPQHLLGHHRSRHRRAGPDPQVQGGRPGRAHRRARAVAVSPPAAAQLMATTYRRKPTKAEVRRQKMEAAVMYPIDWLEERSGLVGGLRYFLFRNVPSDINWMQTLGSAALTAFLVQAITGVILAMYYTPSAATDPATGKPVAWESIVNITDHVTMGWLVRGMHRWGASVFIILMFLHMGRVFLFGAYKYPRELNWIVGVLILVMGLMEGFTGYLLPWDQTAYWASVVGINLNGTAPFLGPWLAQFLRGGQE